MQFGVAHRQPGWWAGLPFLVCLIASQACSTPIGRLEAALRPCGTLPALDSPFRWIGTTDPRDEQRRRAWCEPVGPVALGRITSASIQTSPGDLLVVSWNVAVGGGDVERLVRTLADRERRAGRGEPAFVLLLQEAYRAGAAVPATYSRAAQIPKRIVHAMQQRRDIEALASRLGMHYVYVPSMRNGGLVPGERGEDRGNAILSSLPLRDLVAIELPVEHQRRVAVAASVTGRDGPITFVSVHLDTRRSLLHGSIFSGPLARKRQAGALLAALAAEQTRGPVIVGGDFNTLAGAREPAIRSMEQQFVRVSCGSRITHAWGLSLDYLFASDAVLLQECDRSADRFESDHHPLVARYAGFSRFNSPMPVRMTATARQSAPK